MSKRQHPNLYYWRAGAEAFERLCGKRLYVCPLCLTGFREDQAIDELSREHVPPEKLGGRRMVLTCRKCNSRAGSELDHHAITEERVHRFAADESYGRLPVHLSFAGLDVIAELRKQDNTNIISVLSQCNSWTKIERFAEAAHTWGNGTELQILFRRGHIPKRSQISWLRSAYLLAFAWLGYRYVLREVLETIRIQIRDPSTPHIGSFYTFDASAEGCRIGVVREPSWAHAILVVAKGRIVLLPLFDRDHSLYERVADLGQGGLNIRGPSFGWPDKAIYRLDHATTEELATFSSLRW